MDVISIPVFSADSCADKNTFLAALKFIRKMNLVPKCKFELSKSEDHFDVYNVTHLTPPLLVPFIKRASTYQVEIINSKLDNQIVITSTPLNADDIPFMRTNTVFTFDGDRMTVHCQIAAKLFRNKPIPKIVKGIFTDFANKKAKKLRLIEQKTYLELKSMVF